MISALEHRDRITGIDLWALTKPRLERCAALMEEPFQSLKNLHLNCLAGIRDALVITDTFLGGSAPRLQVLELWHIQFPTLPRFLLSASGLVNLHLEISEGRGTFPPT